MIYLTTTRDDIKDHEIELCSIEECLKLLDNCNKDYIELDTETIDEDIIMIQFGLGSDQVVIDTTTIDIALFKSFLEETDKTFILHNAKFDFKKFYNYSIDVKKIYDVFIVECILTTGFDIQSRRLGLNDLCNEYLGVHMDKSIRQHIHRLGVCTSTVKYAAGDVMYMDRIREKQLKLIEHWELENIVELENKLVRVLAKMEHRGIRLDKERWLEANRTSVRKLQELEEELDSIVMESIESNKEVSKKLSRYINRYKVGNLFFDDNTRKTNINWKSSQQKVEVLNALGIDVLSADKNILKDNISKHKIIPMLIEYSQSAKLVTAFGVNFLKFINPKTGRIHGNHWQIISTGRMSMNNPNLQQMPSHGEVATTIRSAFMSSEGYKMVCADYSSFELAIIAEFSQDPVWIEVLNDGRDLHGELCSMTFNIPLSDIRKPFPYKKEFTYRDVQKTIDFMLAYGGSEYKLSSVIKVDVGKAKKIIQNFFSKIPKVKKFLTVTGELAKLRGYIATPRPLRRIRWFPEWKEEYKNYKSINLTNEDYKILGSIERRGKNAPIQGTNANLIKKALVTLQDEIDANGWNAFLLLTIHDEILSEVAEDQAEEWSKVKEKIMIECTKNTIKTVTIKAKPVIEDYWVK